MGFIVRRLSVAAIVLALSCALSSCDEEDLFVPDMVGSWTLVEAGGFPVYGMDADNYKFYRDGTGDYSYYDPFGRIIVEGFEWEITNRDRIFVYFWNGSSYNWFYDYDGNYMYFSDYPDFSVYDVYARDVW